MAKRILGFVAVVIALIAVLLHSQRETGPFKVSGFIEADEIRIGSRVGGRVLSVHAEEGRAVRAGEKLVVLEPFHLGERRAEAEAHLAERQAEYARLAAGFRPEEIAQAKARRDQIQARLDRLVKGPRAQEIEVAKSQLTLAQSELDRASSDYERVKALVEASVSSPEDLDRAT